MCLHSYYFLLIIKLNRLLVLLSANFQEAELSSSPFLVLSLDSSLIFDGLDSGHGLTDKDLTLVWGSVDLTWTCQLLDLKHLFNMCHCWTKGRLGQFLFSALAHQRGKTKQPSKTWWPLTQKYFPNSFGLFWGAYHPNHPSFHIKITFLTLPGACALPCPCLPVPMP
jgi:hypothetical protein